MQAVLNTILIVLQKKMKYGDYSGAITDYTKAIEIKPKVAEIYGISSISKQSIGDIKGACRDAKEADTLGWTASVNKSWIKDNC